MGVTEYPTKIFADQVTAKVISSISALEIHDVARATSCIAYALGRDAQVAMGANVLKSNITTPNDTKNLLPDNGRFVCTVCQLLFNWRLWRGY